MARLPCRPRFYKVAIMALMLLAVAGLVAGQTNAATAETPPFQQWALSFPPEGCRGVRTGSTDDLNFTEAFTLEAWLYPDPSAHDWSYIFSKNDGATGYSLRVRKGKYILDWCKQSVTSKSDLVPEQWVHVCAVADHGKARLYLNGRLDNEAEAPKPAEPNALRLIVGSSPFGPTYAWKGKMARMRIWSRALTAAEAAYAATGAALKDSSGIVVSWPMSEGAGDNLSDQSGRGHEASIQGASWVMINAPVSPPAENVLARNVLVIAAHGDVDPDVMLTAFRNVIRQATAIPGVTKILVDLDTPGGLVLAADDIVKAVGSAPDRIEFYAYISGDEHRGAFSAGAIIALSCRHIAMRPGTSIGAAMVVASDKGVTEKAAPKFQAAWAAEARSLAEKNGHPPAVAEAMVLTDMVLYVAPAARGFRFFDAKTYASLSSGEKAKAKVAKPAGKILALTSEECAHYGLTTLTEPDAVPGMLGITDETERKWFMGRWRAAVTSTKQARKLFETTRERFAALITLAGKQEVGVAVRLHPRNPIADGTTEYFRSTAKMLDDLAACCQAIVVCGGNYASFAEVVKIADSEGKRAMLASRRIKALIAKGCPPNDSQKLFVELGMDFVTPVFHKE